MDPIAGQSDSVARADRVAGRAGDGNDLRDGLGAALAIGLVLVGQEALAVTGSSSRRAVLGWMLCCLAAGEGLIALGWMPTLIPTPEVHGLAVLMAIGVAFSYRSLRSALIEKENAASLTESRERRFRALVQSSSDLVFVVNLESAVTYASPSCTKVLGYAPDMLLGPESGVLIHEDEIDDLRATIGEAVTVPGGTAEFSFRVRHRDGTWHWLEGLATNLLEDPAVEGVIINARDVTERRARTERQDAIAVLGREVLQETSLSVVMHSGASVVQRMIGARECRIVLAFDEPEDTTSTDPESLSQVDPGTEISLCVPVGAPDRPLARIEIVMDREATAEERQFVEAVASIVLSAIVRTRAEDQIRHQAMHDPLTGLPNRALFNDRLERALSRRARVGGYLAVMIVDLDGFKNVNDSLGHLAGDALLVAVADRFRTLLRGFDTIARLGGDEFAMLVDDLESADSSRAGRATGTRRARRTLQLPDRAVAIGASIGIALADRPDASGDRILSHADAAMYRAKREGKGCYRVFEAAMHSAAFERMTLEQELRSAIAEGSLTVHYQPVVDTYTGRVASFEALARWPHPTRGFVPPATFIPIAEESGLILELGHAVLVTACQQAREWQLSLPDQHLCVTVNASRLQLAHPSFLEHIADALARAELEPSSLTLEVTESVLAHDSGRIIATLDEVRRMGTRVAIDDFGTGYSSFAALAELPIDILKIDQQFIANLLRDHQGRGFVNAIMQIAQTLNLETVAEGVEHQDQHDALAALGCTYIQGYLHSRPIPADQTGRFLEQTSATGISELVRARHDFH